MARQLCETRPEIGVLILTQHADPSLALELFETRSAGRVYRLNERVANRGGLVAAIKALADRRSLVDPSIVDDLIAERARPPAWPPDGLTAREREVLAEGVNRQARLGNRMLLSSPRARSRSTSTRTS